MTTTADLTAEKLYCSAFELFAEFGYNRIEPGDIARHADCDLDELFRRFPLKASFVMHLYERLALDLEGCVGELQPGRLAARFKQVMTRKFDLLAPHVEVLRHLLPSMVDPTHKLGVLGPHVDAIRTRVQGIFAAVVHGATDAPPLESRDQAIRFMYALHVGLVFLFLVDETGDGQAAHDGIEAAADAITVGAHIFGKTSTLDKVVTKLAGLPSPDKIRGSIDRVVSRFIRPPHDSSHFDSAHNLLRDLFRYRRVHPDAGSCAREPCAECLALHLPRVEVFLSAEAPIHLVLPAFPAKSPNLGKVIGATPDLGEELALRFLQERCDAISKYYPPGAKLTICSDGRVFSDVVGVSDCNVTAYRARLVEMIEDFKLQSLEVFDLDDVRPSGVEAENYDALRNWLTETYAESLETVADRCRLHACHQQLFNGIHRFMSEDLLIREDVLSKNQARKQAKQLAYQVIQRSNAWSRLVAGVFPNSLRLSIHPQPAHSEKIGIMLNPADDVWLTPWHGVVVLRDQRFELTRRAAAEAMGAILIERDGRASHFELTKERSDA